MSDFLVELVADVVVSAGQGIDEHERRRRTPPAGGVLAYPTIRLMIGVVGFALFGFFTLCMLNEDALTRIRVMGEGDAPNR